MVFGGKREEDNYNQKSQFNNYLSSLENHLKRGKNSYTAESKKKCKKQKLRSKTAIHNRNFKNVGENNFLALLLLCYRWPDIWSRGQNVITHFNYQSPSKFSVVQTTKLDHPLTSAEKENHEQKEILSETLFFLFVCLVFCLTDWKTM